LAYAITIHKAQGISVDKAILNLSGKQDFAAGLTYVAISRVRSLRGIVFEEPFGLSRLKYKPSETVIMRNADYVRRGAQEVREEDVSMPEATLTQTQSSDYGELDIDDLPEVPPSQFFIGPGRAGQIVIPVLHAEPIHSTITITSGPSGPITSDAVNEGEDEDDVDMSGGGSYS
jgi:hypothetical protein